MPLYEYQCPKCGRFELIKKFSDTPLTACPTCGSEVQKLPSAPAIQFKGTGWYITDYARKSEGTAKGDAGKGDQGKGDASKGDTGKGDGAKGDGAKGDAGKAGASKSEGGKESSSAPGGESKPASTGAAKGGGTKT
ncbi:MAG TPA: zinc ribbon domain-containing protein [Vicinamibacteria bacterium]|nr:zinc ribbon domain-containing protein [Vicinamibacteria bacterium]